MTMSLAQKAENKLMQPNTNTHCEQNVQALDRRDAHRHQTCRSIVLRDTAIITRLCDARYEYTKVDECVILRRPAAPNQQTRYTFRASDNLNEAHECVYRVYAYQSCDCHIPLLSCHAERRSPVLVHVL